MASSPTSRLRLMKQATYDNPDSWGVELNQGALDMMDEALGVSEIAVDANVTLTVANFLSDQARRFVLVATGAGGFTVTVPQVDKPYWVINNCTADITVTPQGGTGALIRAGTYAMWYCDGTDGFVCDMTLDKVAAPTASLDLNSQKIINLGAPTADADAVTKKYLDDLAASSDLGTVAAIAPEIVTLAHIQDGTVATDAITDVAAVADDVALLGPISDDITQLAGMFVGASATDPTTRLDGTALQAGDYYLNNAGTPTVRVYGGTSWIPIETVTLASQAEAEAGTNNTHVMTPLRSKQAIDINAIEYGIIPLGALLTPSNVATVDITLPPGYDQYVLKFWELVPGTDNQKLWLRTSTDGGSSFDAGASDYSTQIVRALASSVSTAAETVAQIQLTNSTGGAEQIGNASNEDGAFGSLTIHNPTTAKYTYIRSLTGYANASNGLPFFSDCLARRNAASDVNAIRIMFASGNIASGFLQLYGVVTG